MADTRPECMVRLNLLPPYAREDVKQAYATKATFAHPDHGGSIDAFLALQDAYVAAKEYVSLRGDRRQWIAAMVEKSLRQDRLIEQLKKHDADVTTNSTELLEESLGDFADLVESITAVTLLDSMEGDVVIRLLASEKDVRMSLCQLCLTGSRVSDREVENLKAFTRLSRVDLRDTPITQDALSFVLALPTLTQLDLRGTNVGWRARQETERILQRRGGRHANGEQHAEMPRKIHRRQWPSRPT